MLGAAQSERNSSFVVVGSVCKAHLSISPDGVKKLSDATKEMLHGEEVFWSQKQKIVGMGDFAQTSVTE